MAVLPPEGFAFICITCWGSPKFLLKKSETESKGLFPIDIK